VGCALTTRKLVQSLVRGLTILEQVAHSENGLSLSDLAGQLSLKPTTVHNLARTLVAKRFLVKKKPGVRYLLGAATLELAQMYESHSLVRHARRLIPELWRSAPNSLVMLAVDVGGEIVSRLRITWRRPGVLQGSSPVTLHPYGSGAPIVFQAFWSPQECALYRRKYPFREFGAQFWKTPDRLETALRRVRRRGFAVLRFKGFGTVPMAAPVFGAGNQLVACVTMALPEQGLTPPALRRHVKAMLGAAAELSAAGPLPKEQGEGSRHGGGRQEDVESPG